MKSQQIYAKLFFSSYFEDAAFDMFNEIFKSNKEKLEYHFLAYDYEWIFRTVEPGFPETEYESRELLYIAYEGKCMVGR